MESWGIRQHGQGKVHMYQKQGYGGAVQCSVVKLYQLQVLEFTKDLVLS